MLLNLNAFVHDLLLLCLCLYVVGGGGGGDIKAYED
jgi:Flp pilus assembly protein protease CpaA